MNVKRPIKIQYGESSIEVLTKYEDMLIDGIVTEASGDEEIIQAGLFSYCGLLSLVSFPQCTTIGEAAFYQCSSLRSVSFPQCTTISSRAFYHCSLLQSVDFPQCSIIGNYAFGQCSSLQSANIPQCTTIGSRAFLNCTSLRIASFPQCVSIDDYAFQDCSSLQSVYLLASSVCTLLSSTAFISTPIQYSSYLGYYGSIYVPSSLVNSYKTATNWAYYTNQITAFQG